MDGDGWVSRLTGLMQAGGVLDLVPAGEVPNPGLADLWGEDRRIPAGVVREVLLWAARNPQQVDPKGLRIRGADVTGRVDLESINVPCQVELEDCRLADGITLDSATMPYLSLERSHLGTPTLPHDSAIQAIGATISGQLNMGGATLTNPNGYSLSLDQAHITGSVFLNEEFTAEGEVRAIGASIGGTLNMSGATLTNPGGHALALDRADITGGVFLNEGFTADGEVRAIGASIGGTLNMSGARLTNPGGTALSLGGTSITGGVFLNEGFTAKGEVRAVEASIGGTLNMSGARLTNPGGTALSLDGANIPGAVFLDGFTAKGHVRANGATIGGQLNLTGATLTSPNGYALVLESADVKTVILSTVKDITGAVNLASCRIDTLFCPAEGYPPGALVANGWRLRFVHGQVGTDAKVAQAWLNTRPDHVPFSPQPGRELADMYDRAGHPDQARAMRHNAAQGITKHSTGWSRLRLWSYNLIAGHGYYPHRVIGWLGLIFAIAIAVTATSPQLFEPADYPKATAAAETVALQTGNPAPPTLTGATPCPQLGTYPCFPRFTYALQTVIPPATVITTTAWQPATNTILALFTILKAAGWILVVLFLATITGLLKRT